jgi:hypothetical protein
MLETQYQCADCHRWTIRSGTSADHVRPLCCGVEMRWRRMRSYSPANEDWATGMRAPALDFNQTRGRLAPVGDHGIPINSLHDIRRLERESAKQEADGAGQALRFVKYSMDAGNETRGLLDTRAKPRLFDDRGRRKLSMTPVPADEAGEIAVGPGIRGGGASPFD